MSTSIALGRRAARPLPALVVVALLATIALLVATGSAQAAGRGGKARLTQEQRQCLAEQGIEKPNGRPTASERQARRKALAACGIEKPGNHSGRWGGQGNHRRGGFFAGLTPQQRQCLAGRGIGKPTGWGSKSEHRALREAVREAAGACGIELPD